MVSLSGFGLSAAINGGIALIVFSLFLWLRRSEKNRFVYSPRLLHECNRQGRPLPPLLSSSWFSWIYTVIFVISNQDILQSCGLDAYMFIRYLEMCAKLFAFMTVFGVGILVPVSYTIADGLATDPFDTISLANITTNDDRLAAFILVAYLFSACTYYSIYDLYRDYCTLRKNFLAQEYLQNRRLTLLVTNIPKTITDNSQFQQAMIEQANNANNGLASSTTSINSSSNIYSAFLATNVGELDQSVLNRDAALNNLEHALISFQLKPEERPMTATKYLCCDKQDAINWHTKEYNKFNDEVMQAQAAKHDVYDNGFVTCSSVTAYQSMLLAKPNPKAGNFVQPASELRDVYWPALSFDKNKRFSRAIIMGICLYLLVGFWLIPVGFVQSIANLSELSTAVPFLSFVADIPAGLLAIIDGFLPGLVLTIFNIVLPMILYQFAKMEGIFSFSQLSERVITTFFLFQVFSNFIGSQLVTAMAKDPSTLFSDPSQITNILGSTIPATSTFFITYILLTALAGYPLMLLNPGGIIVGKLKKKYLVKSTRDLMGVETAPPLDYGTTYPTSLFVFIIAICFSLLASIILPFAVLYFSFAWFANKYTVLYVTNNSFENGGKFWPVVMRKMMYCIVIAQIIFTLVLGLKQAPGPAVVSAPLILFPFVFMYVMEAWFKFPADKLSLVETQEIDVIRAKMQSSSALGHRVGTDSTFTFLDEVNQIQRINYDALIYRCMQQHDFQYPHNLVTPYLTKILLHSSIPTSDENLSKQETEKNDDSNKEQVTVTISKTPTETNLVRQTSSSSTTQVSVMETILQASHLNSIAPQFDFVQPSLLVPHDLPLPQQVRILDQPSLCSIETDRSIFLAQWTHLSDTSTSPASVNSDKMNDDKSEIEHK